ncbi:hypothetical protein DQK91_03150 [Oceanidesulfovibrio marinus]|uniref:histidine kinase n=2 Tax=Oceanidesulfovibrio marinus TaxID=370038 RepID=A0A6P1ZN52_9BACT|nr:hypothetical protein DQK91_03150 [Oceanidesulfovibrio marinus]
MARCMKRFRLGVGRKLLLTNAAAGLLFIAFSVVVLVKLSTIEGISSSLISDSLHQIIDNSSTARKLSMAFARAASLMGNFYENEQLLEEESRRLLTDIDVLASSAHGRSLRTSLEDYRRSLVMVFESCRVVNLVLARLRRLENSGLRNMDQAEFLYTSDADASDTPRLQEQLSLLKSLKEDMLRVAVLRTEYWPKHFARDVRGGDVLAMAVNELRIQMQAYTAVGNGDAATVRAFKLAAGKYLDALGDLHRVTRNLKVATQRVNTHQDAILAEMASLDKEAANTSLAARGQIVSITNSARSQLILLAVGVLLGLVTLTQFFRLHNFQLPLENLRRGIESLRAGNLERRIDLSRDDEWNIMEEAINHMASELSRSYQSIEESASFYRSLFELGLIGMAVMDETGSGWLEINDRFCEVLRYSRDEIMTRQWSDLIHQKDYVTESIRFASLRNGEIDGYALDVRFTRGDGSIAYTMLSVKCTRTESGRIKAVYILLNDISKRVQTQQQLDAVNKNLEQLVEERSQSLLEKTRELEEANRRLRELDQLKSDFLSSISHELRTPLTSILGFAKLVNRELTRFGAQNNRDSEDITARLERMQANLDIIAREGERLTRLINEILDLSKIESGQVEWRDIICSSRALALQAMEAVEPQFQQKPGVELRLDVSKADTLVRVDPDRYLQVCINLLNNALKFTPSGSITITAQPTDEGYYRFSVQDTGVGIAPDDMERIFDKFHQAPTNDTLRDKPMGTGLGLSISSQIVDHYGGRIWVQSAPGKGSTFTFEIPSVTGHLADDQPENGAAASPE